MYNGKGRRAMWAELGNTWKFRNQGNLGDRGIEQQFEGETGKMFPNFIKLFRRDDQRKFKAENRKSREYQVESDKISVIQLFFLNQQFHAD